MRENARGEIAAEGGIWHRRAAETESGRQAPHEVGRNAWCPLQSMRVKARASGNRFPEGSDLSDVICRICDSCRFPYDVDIITWIVEIPFTANDSHPGAYISAMLIGFF